MLDNTTSTIPAPDGSGGGTRTAFEIFSTCVSTMLVCVWSVMHIEVPTRRRSAAGGFAHRLRCMLLGVFMPPWLLYLAAAQLIIAARLLATVYCEIGRVLPPPPRGWVYRNVLLRAYFRRTDEDIPLADLDEEGDRKHPWTLTHAFFAVMGGYVIDTTKVTHTKHRGRFALTPRGVAWVLQSHPNLIPDVSEEEIEDRSKADTLAKLLSLSQALFFCVSCVDRGIKHLPFTLFEILTLAHALCTVLTYVVWFNKPFSIMEPTVLAGDSTELRAAAEYLITNTPSSELRPRKRRPLLAAAFNGEASAYARDPPPFDGFPCLAREASLISYNALDLDSWRAGVLSACAVLYALPLFLGWRAAPPGQLADLWRKCACALLFAGLAEALVLAHLLEPAACVGNGAPLAPCVTGLNVLLMFGSLVGYAGASFTALLVALLQLVDLPPGALEQTPVFKYWPHLS